MAVGFSGKFIFIAGPCVIEDRRSTMDIASRLKDITSAYPVEFVFKASFDKANRTSVDSARGPQLTKGLNILAEVKNKLNLAVTSDVHCVQQVKPAAEVLDIIQIPAFLSRQTDLIAAAARSKKTVNIKKGQFMAPQDIKYAASKATACGNKHVLLTERGVSFGYNNLVVDFRSFLIMRQFGFPVIYDVTHSLQRPAAAGGISGGDRQFVPAMARAAAACGVDGLFMEVHPKPEKSFSDKHTVFPLDKVKQLLKTVLEIRAVSHD